MKDSICKIIINRIDIANIRKETTVYFAKA